jgi:hypothetical protein
LFCHDQQLKRVQLCVGRTASLFTPTTTQHIHNTKHTPQHTRHTTQNTPYTTDTNTHTQHTYTTHNTPHNTPHTHTHLQAFWHSLGEGKGVTPMVLTTRSEAPLLQNHCFFMIVQHVGTPYGEVAPIVFTTSFAPTLLHNHCFSSVAAFWHCLRWC